MTSPKITLNGRVAKPSNKCLVSSTCHHLNNIGNCNCCGNGNGEKDCKCNNSKWVQISIVHPEFRCLKCGTPLKSEGYKSLRGEELEEYKELVNSINKWWEWIEVYWMHDDNIEFFNCPVCKEKHKVVYDENCKSAIDRLKDKIKEYNHIKSILKKRVYHKDQKSYYKCELKKLRKEIRTLR